MIRIGCCGFPTSMQKYFENFSLVELNSTFYQYPRFETVEGWRKKAPENFEFTVKAHQDISHKAKMKSNDICLQSFAHMKQICKILNSRILLIQTPNSFSPDRLSNVEDFFKKVNRGDLILVWETRGSAWETYEVCRKLERVLGELNVTHVTDPFRILPAYTGEIAYFRLHGLGKQMYYYQYSNVELQRLKELVTPYEKAGKTVYILFNNLSMFEDAKRFAEYLSKDVFPKLTSASGLVSIKEIVEKTRYPTSKSMLIKKVGWRLVETAEGKQVRLDTFLSDLPSKTYKNVQELLNAIESTKKLALSNFSFCKFTS